MKSHSKLTYQLSFKNVSRKVDYHAGGKWFIHGPKRRKENQLLSLKHPCWLSLVKHENMRSMAACSVHYSKSKVRGQKHPSNVVKIETAS